MVGTKSRPVKTYDNGMADGDGRLTAKGKAAVAEILKKWPAPVAFLVTWPTINDAVWRLLKGGPDGDGTLDRSRLDDLHQDMWAEAIRRVPMYDPGNAKGASLETYVLWGFVKVASAWVDRTIREFGVGNGGKPLGSLSFEVADGVEMGELVFQDDGDESAPAERFDPGRPFGRFQDTVDRLDERKRLVLELRYVGDRTLEEVGQVIGVSKERARQIEAKARELVTPADAPTKADRSTRESRRKARGVCQRCPNGRWNGRLLCKACQMSRPGGPAGRPRAVKLAGAA